MKMFQQKSHKSYALRIGIAILTLVDLSVILLWGGSFKTTQLVSGGSMSLMLTFYPVPYYTLGTYPGAILLLSAGLRYKRYFLAKKQSTLNIKQNNASLSAIIVRLIVGLILISIPFVTPHSIDQKAIDGAKRQMQKTCEAIDCSAY